MTNTEKLIQVSFNEKGVYFMYQIPVQRGIKGKTKSIVNELLIVGIPHKQVDVYCIKEKIYITNKYVRDAETDDPILFRELDTWTYVEKEKL